MFFDLGDTLVDNTVVWRRMLEDLRLALFEMGREHSLDELSALFEQASAEYARNPFTEVQIRLGLDKAGREFVEERCNWQHELETVLPGACEFLAYIAQHYKLGVIANQAPGSQERCKEWGLMPYFSTFIASAEVGLKKPDPGIFQLALDMAGCEPERAVMVGDRIDNDIRPARLLGMKTIRLVRGYQRFQQPRDEWDRADVTVYSFAEMQSCLLKR